MKIGDEVYIHGYVDEIRKDTIIIRNKGGYFGTVQEEVVPSAQPPWIPCSERLPEIGEKGTSDMVLLCWSDGQRTVGAYQGNRTFVGQAWPEARSCRVTVTAWMPLPNPWRGETE